MPRLVNDSGLFTMSEFRNRGVIKLSPDILVYVSGNLGSRVISPVTGNDQKLDFNDGITTVGIQNNIDPPGSSSATVEITTPIYGENSKYWVPFEVDGKITRVPFFVPMMEVKIYAKGRFLHDFKPRYYPCFWGFITNVEENFSGGVWKITLNCADMLHWWEYSQVNIHPIPETNIAMGGNQSITAFSTIFRDANPFTIMYRLALDMYVPNTQEDQRVASAAFHRFVTPTWLAQKTPLNQIYPPRLLRAAAIGIMSYWQQRFGQLGTNLKMVGAAGSLVKVTDSTGRRITVIEEEPLPVEDPGTSKKKRADNDRLKKKFDVSQFLNNFTVFFEFENMSDFADAEYMSKLEIATEVKNRVEYEFFQDVDGTLMFKPPYYNLNTRYVEPYIIRPYDIISNSFQTDAEAIITVLEIKTPFHGQIRSEEAPSGIGFHMDIDLAKRYGIKYKTMTLQYIRSDAKVANQLALGHMGLVNSKAFTGSITIPGRPEIRMGYPVYIDHRDAFSYVRSINHSFDYAGSFTTTLSLEAERKRVFNFDENTGTWSKDPLKNRVYLFNNKLGENSIKKINLNENDEKSRELLKSTQRLYTIEQGRYEIATFETASSNFSSTVDLASVTDRTVPYTDEEGYRVIGSFRYGRGIKVDGKTRMTNEEIAAVRGTTGVTVEDIRTNESVTMMTPSFYGESMKMKTFFDQVQDDQEGIIPSYIDTDNMSIALKDQTTESGGTPQNVLDIVYAYTPTWVANQEKNPKLVPDRK